MESSFKNYSQEYLSIFQFKVAKFCKVRITFIDANKYKIKIEPYGS